MRDQAPTRNYITHSKPNYQHPSDKYNQKEAKKFPWKKCLIFTVVLLLILGVILLTISLLNARYSPKIKTQSKETSYDGSLERYQVTSKKKNMMGKDQNSNFTATHIKNPSKQRLLQSGPGQSQPQTIEAMVLTFSYPEQGIVIHAGNVGSYIVEANPDKIVKAYSERNPEEAKRLLFFGEMVRSLQSESSAEESNLAISTDSISQEADMSLLRTVAKGMDRNPDDLSIVNSQVISLVLQSDGSYEPQDIHQTSRLLTSVEGLRSLQEWQGIFDRINEAVLLPRLQEAEQVLKTFVVDIDRVQDESADGELKRLLKNSNFNPNSAQQIVIENSEDQDTPRLLVDAQENNPKDSQTNKTNANQTTKNQKNNTEEEDGNEKSEEKQEEPTPSNKQISTPSSQDSSRPSKSSQSSSNEPSTPDFGNTPQPSDVPQPSTPQFPSQSRGPSTQRGQQKPKPKDKQKDKPKPKDKQKDKSKPKENQKDKSKLKDNQKGKSKSNPSNSKQSKKPDGTVSVPADKVESATGCTGKENKVCHTSVVNKPTSTEKVDPKKLDKAKKDKVTIVKVDPSKGNNRNGGTSPPSKPKQPTTPKPIQQIKPGTNPPSSAPKNPPSSPSITPAKTPPSTSPPTSTPTAPVPKPAIPSTQSPNPPPTPVPTPAKAPTQNPTPTPAPTPTPTPTQTQTPAPAPTQASPPPPKPTPNPPNPTPIPVPAIIVVPAPAPKPTTPARPAPAPAPKPAPAPPPKHTAPPAPKPAPTPAPRPPPPPAPRPPTVAPAPRPAPAPAPRPPPSPPRHVPPPRPPSPPQYYRPMNPPRHFFFRR